MGFDFDHTLGIDNKLERVAFLQMLDAACTSGGSCIGTLDEEIRCIDAILAKQRSGAFSIEEAVETFMRERGAPDPQAYPARYKQLCIDMVPSFVIPEPEVREMLAQLRERGVPCGILTNGWSPLQQHKARRVSFSGPVLVSSDLGVQKPDVAAFDALAKALGVPREEIAYVGDTPASDVAGALRAGMTAIWFDAEGIPYPQELPPPSASIRRLTELLSFV